MGIQQMLLAVRGIQPLGNVVPSCVFDLDATIADSYTSGQVWANWEPTPADGSAQSAYNFNRGTSSGSQASDPTFNGSAGSPSAYWSFDGGDFFQIAGGNTNLLRDMGKVASSINIGFCACLRLANTANQGIISNRLATGSGAGAGAGLEIISAESTLAQNGNNANVQASTGASLSTGVNYFIAGTWNRGANQATIWVNGTEYSGISMTFQTGTNNPPDLLIGARYSDGPTIANIFTNNNRLYAASMFNETLDAAKVNRIKKQYELRHQRSYT